MIIHEDQSIIGAIHVPSASVIYGERKKAFRTAATMSMIASTVITGLGVVSPAFAAGILFMTEINPIKVSSPDETESPLNISCMRLFGHVIRHGIQLRTERNAANKWSKLKWYE